MEAHVLLGHALQRPRAWLLANRPEPLTSAQAAQFAKLIARRTQGEPIAYLTGEREFFGLTFQVSPAVLIPRPDTELLVELALALIPERSEMSILDLGTGSGAIAISLAKHRPNSQVMAIEQSSAALAIAQANAQRHGVNNLRLLQGDWFGALGSHDQFDLILSNPPYIADNDAHLGQGDLRFEPHAALASGADGLDSIRTIVATAPKHLQPGGHLLVEHGWQQGAAVREILLRAEFKAVASHRDLAGIERVTHGVFGLP